MANDIEIGDKVVYIPDYLLKGPAKDRIQDKNLGVVTSKNDTFVFVRYANGTNSQATSPEDLFSLRNRPDLANNIDDL